MNFKKKKKCEKFKINKPNESDNLALDYDFVCIFNEYDSKRRE